MQLARDASSLVILQLEQSCRQLTKTLISGIELRRAFLDPFLQLSLRFTQDFIIAAPCFTQGHDYERNQRKSHDAGELFRAENTQRVSRRDEPILSRNQ